MRELTAVLQVQQPVALGVVEELRHALDSLAPARMNNPERNGRCASLSCQDLREPTLSP